MIESPCTVPVWISMVPFPPYVVPVGRLLSAPPGGGNMLPSAHVMNDLPVWCEDAEHDHPFEREGVVLVRLHHVRAGRFGIEHVADLGSAGQARYVEQAERGTQQPPDAEIGSHVITL